MKVATKTMQPLKALDNARMRATAFFLMPDEKARLKRICAAKGSNPHREIRQYVAQLFHENPHIL